MKIELLFGAVTVGLGATFVMDLWTIFSGTLSKFFTQLLLCWSLAAPHGQCSFKHPSITAAAQKPAECTTGWIAHYAIGVLFALALVALATPEWLRSPTLMPALIFGIVTVGFPFFIMHHRSALALPRQRPKSMQARCVAL